MHWGHKAFGGIDNQGGSFLCIYRPFVASHPKWVVVLKNMFKVHRALWWGRRGDKENKYLIPSKAILLIYVYM